MKKTNEFPFGIGGVVEEVYAAGGRRLDVYGPTCERTRQVAEAFERGEAPPHPDDPRAARCGPARVTTEAYRAGWDAINWSGRRKEVGQA